MEARETPVIVTTKEINVEFQTHNKKGFFVNKSMYVLNVACSGIIDNDVESNLSSGLIEMVKTLITGYKAIKVNIVNII